MSQSQYSLGFTTLASETSIEDLPIRGTVPTWLTGMLIRTGPARFEVGDQQYNHWFDGLAMLHKYTFAAGQVSYVNCYLHSQAYEEAMAEGTISRREFATDPCRTLFQRVVSWFSPKLTDNGAVNIAQWADAVVALTESRLPVRFDPDTLATLGVWTSTGSRPHPGVRRAAIQVNPCLSRRRRRQMRTTAWSFRWCWTPARPRPFY